MVLNYGGKSLSTAADELEKTIRNLQQTQADLIEKRNKLNAEISKNDRNIKTLNESYKIITGKSLIVERSNNGVLDYAEELLKTHKKLHVKEIIGLLESEYKISARFQTVSSGLTRFHNQGKRFERVGKNTYTLRKEK